MAAHQIKNEIDAHRKLSLCGNALKLQKVYESDHSVYMILDYQPGGSLLNVLKDER